MPLQKILVVDDEPLIGELLKEILQRQGYETHIAENGARGLALAQENGYDLIFTDMRMPDMTGIDLLKRLKEISPETIVVVMTAFGTIENAVEATRLGAFQYLLKPFSEDAIDACLEKAEDHLSLVRENEYLKKNFSNRVVVARSPAMQTIMKDALRVAKSRSSVFITGESGTGKEVIAEFIHTNSPRKDRPFIKVNCAAVPETLIESEFVGHEKGAFTSALAKRLGRFELAHTGTLLLDEVTEIPYHLQSKLLRVIQEQEFERLGGTKPIQVDIRFIAASNRNIQEAITTGFLREDLFYRLNVVPLHLPALRERKEDILPLAEHFLKKFCYENHKKETPFSKETEQMLTEYNWPGNVRELANCIERAVVMEEPPLIGQKPIPFLEEKKRSQTMTLEEVEKRHIMEALKKHANNRDKAAELLGISPNDLKDKIIEHHLF